jgi:hypothetical protein
MSFQKIYDSVLKDWLPTKWSRWIAGLTPSTATGGIFLPNLLQKIDIHPTPEQTLLTRLSLPPTILFVGTFIVLLLTVRHFKSPQKQPNKEETKKINQTQEEVMLEQIILHILRLRGANETASPKKIAELMGQDTGVIFAYMWKLHNEQYMTFQTGGAMPTVDTDFFLSPKAYGMVKLGSA